MGMTWDPDERLKEYEQKYERCSDETPPSITEILIYVALYTAVVAVAIAILFF